MTNCHILVKAKCSYREHLQSGAKGRGVRGPIAPAELLKNLHAVVPVELKCSKSLFAPLDTSDNLYFTCYILYVLAHQQEDNFTFTQQHFYYIMGPI